jgi:hypothetical protein
MKPVKEVKIFTEGIWNMAEVITDDGMVKGNWNELNFRNEVLGANNGCTHFNDQRNDAYFNYGYY